MKFVLIFGPQAVGKMTVGQELASMTGMKLFHNHMTIEMLEPLFGFTPEMWRLTNQFRMEIFKSAAASEMEGLIFTCVWAFNEQEDWDFVNDVCKVFESEGADVYFIELEAELERKAEQESECEQAGAQTDKKGYCCVRSGINEFDADVSFEFT